MAVGTVSGLRAYAIERGVINPALSANELASQALTRANDYIRFNYITKFANGYTESSPHVEPAVYEAAILELETPGFFHRTWTAGERKVLTEAKGIKWTLVGGGTDGGPAATSTLIESMLRPYMAGAGGIALYVI